MPQADLGMASSASRIRIRSATSGAARNDQRAAVGERVSVRRHVARAALEDDRRAQDREGSDSLQRHERFAEQPCREGDPTTGSKSIRMPARVPPNSSRWVRRRRWPRPAGREPE